MEKRLEAGAPVGRTVVEELRVTVEGLVEMDRANGDARVAQVASVADDSAVGDPGAALDSPGEAVQMRRHAHVLATAGPDDDEDAVVLCEVDLPANVTVPRLNGENTTSFLSRG